jgi:hypothetical protein
MKRWIASWALLALVLISLSPTASAASVDVSGLDKNTGPNVELYMTSGTLDSSELALIINYDDYDMTLKVTKENTTIQSQVIDPHSSMFLELSFPDLAVYKITVSSQSHNVLTLTRERSSTYVPAPTNGNDWVIQQPDKSGDAKYSQSFVDQLINSLTIETLLKTTAAAVLGLILGAGVKRLTLFLTPTDFISYTIAAAAISDMIFNWTGLGISLYYLPVLAGYYLGFIICHVDYILPVQTNCTEKTLDVRPVAIYLPDDGSGYCIQTQKNRELVKRWLGIPHRLGTDAGLPQDWTGYFKRPYLPKVRGRLTWVQKSEVKVEEDHIWKFKAKRFTTTYRLAHASGVEKAQWLNEARWYFKLQDMFDRLSLKYNDLIMGARAESTYISTSMVEHSTSVNPAKRVAKFFLTEQPAIELETDENQFTEIEEASTKEQDGVAQQTPEELETMDYEREASPSERPVKQAKTKNVRRRKDEYEEME